MIYILVQDDPSGQTCTWELVWSAHESLAAAVDTANHHLSEGDAEMMAIMRIEAETPPVVVWRGGVCDGVIWYIPEG